MTEPRADAASVPVSVLIPVRNEELNIRAVLDSVAWASEIWVVDSHSTDRTSEIAHTYTDRVVQFDYDGRGPKKKNWSLENLPFANEWVLIVDADERITPSLAEEIRRAVASDGADGYYLDREYIFMGRSLRSFRPNWNLRLFKHRRGRYELLATNAPATGDNEVHEHVVLDGRIGHLRSPMLHEDRRPLRAWVDNHNRYSDWEANVYREIRREPLSLRGLVARGPGGWRHNGLKRIWVRLPLRPLLRFAAYYVLRRGFLDGREGFRYSLLIGCYEYLTGLKVRELEQAGMSRRRAG
jgi:glycosyltransferase involved in cell wall biosynthesis